MQMIQSGLSENRAVDEYKTPYTNPLKTFSSERLSPNRSINKLYSSSEKDSFTMFLSFSPFKRFSIKRRFVGGIGRPALNQLFTVKTETPNSLAISARENPFCSISFFNSSFSFFIIYPLFYSCSAASKLPSSSNIRPWARQISPARAYRLPRQKLLMASSNSSREEKFFFNLSICSSVNRKTIFPDSSSFAAGYNKTFNAFSCAAFMGRPENQLSTVLLLTPIKSAKSWRDFPLSFSQALILSSNCVLMSSNYARKRNLSSLFYAQAA